MLAITRKVNQKLKIGDDITIIVKNIRGKNVRLLIDAPKEIEINRLDELFQDRKDFIEGIENDRD
jgi:carbon storage regulator